MNTSTSSIIADRERQQIYQLVQSLFHNALHDYIADANRRDVMNELFEFFEKADVTIISKTQLKEATTLNIDMLKVNKNVE